jgi:hypothetical protein
MKIPQTKEREKNDTYLGGGGGNMRRKGKRKKIKMILPLGVMEKKKSK